MRKSKRAIQKKIRNAEKAKRKQINIEKARRKKASEKRIWPFWLRMNMLWILGLFLTLLTFFSLFDKIFISWHTLLAIWLTSGIIFTIPSFWVSETELEEVYGRSSTIEVAFYNCVAIGGILVFSFMTINLSPVTEIETHELEILSKRMHEHRTGSKSPSITIEYKGLQKTFSFKTTELEKAEKATHLTLKTKKGTFGYDVIIDKELSNLE